MQLQRFLLNMLELSERTVVADLPIR